MILVGEMRDRWCAAWRRRRRPVISNGDGRAVAVEVLLATHPIRNHIRHEKLQNIISEITLGKRQGMVSLEDSLARLVKQGMISVEDARVRSARPDELESLLRG